MHVHVSAVRVSAADLISAKGHKMVQTQHERFLLPLRRDDYLVLHKCGRCTFVYVGGNYLRPDKTPN